MNISKKWRDLGWHETDGFYSETCIRTHNGKIQIVGKTPSKTMWKAVELDEQLVPLSNVLYPTMSKALKSLNNP